jgi:hypothetical protein
MSTIETATVPAPPPAPAAHNASRTGAVIGGSILATVGAVMALGGGGLLAVAGTDNTFETGHHDVSTPTTALVSDVANIEGTNEVTDAIGHPRVTISSDAVRNDQPVFVGVAHKADVDRYLAGAEVDKVNDIDTDPFTLDKKRRPGTVKPKPPTTQSFWVAKSSGSTASIDWKVKDGNYRVVVMNADGSKGVATQTKAGLEIPHLSTISLITMLIGLGVGGGGVALLALGGRKNA